MNRIEMIEKVITQSMEDFGSYDLEDMDAAYHNLLEDFLAKCTDTEIQDLFEEAE